MALEINIGEEYKIKIEKTEEFEKSIFKEVYTQATKNVEEIILQANTVSNTKSISNDDYNNVIAFTGERGTGKSSSMISFADALKNKNSKDTFWSETPNLEKTKIKSLDIIDPSLFRNEDKLFEIIISKMFSKFQKKLKKENTIKNDRKRDLIKQFQKVFNNLKVVHNGKSDVYEKEAIEALSDLAFGTNLKENFKKLVDEYLLCMYGIDNSKDKKGFLLIPIDDFDLNISGAYEMLEDIRQFLIQSNVLILIAFKMEQLQDSINNEIIKEYDMIYNFGKDAKVYLSENISNKSNKYLDKLFPLERRFNTPILIENNISSKEMKLYDLQYEIDFKKKLKLEGKEIPKDKVYYKKDQTIEDTFLDLVYDKTKILISKNKFEKNIIIPNTLRDLTNTITLIYRKADINSFKVYLNKEIVSNLSQKEISFFKELETTSNVMLNQFILNWIGENKKDFLNEEIFERGRIIRGRFQLSNKGILTKVKKYYNASFADVLSILRELKNNILVTKTQQSQFLNYLNIYCNIRITEVLNKKDYKNELLNLTNDRLTNNDIKYFPEKRIPNKTSKKRDYFEVYQKPLDLYEYLKQNIKSQEDDQKELTDNYLCIIHFFNFIGKGSVENKTYVEIPEDIKERKGNQYNTITFNAISFLSNITQYNSTIERYVPLNLITSIENSDLYPKLQEWNNNIPKDFFKIYNYSLFDEILKNIQEYSGKNINLELGYGDNLFKFIVEGLKTISKSLSKKYNIDLSSIINNPIINHWKENKENINVLFDLIFEASNNKDELSLKYILEEDYAKVVDAFLKRSKTKLTSGQIPYLITHLNGIENPPNDKLIDKIEQLKKEINDDNFKSVRTKIEFLLKSNTMNG
jgi:hypothetical protein